MGMVNETKKIVIDLALMSCDQKEPIIIIDREGEYEMLKQAFEHIHNNSEDNRAFCGIIKPKRGEIMTIKELCRSIGTDTFEFRLGQFLDDFKRSHDKSLLVKDEPDFVADHKEEMCFIAGAVHKLCNDFCIEVPEWIFKKEYYLDKRVYAFGSLDEDFHRYLRQTSPLEFSCRNYFVPDNTLQRV